MAFHQILLLPILGSCLMVGTLSLAKDAAPEDKKSTIGTEEQALLVLQQQFTEAQNRIEQQQKQLQRQTELLKAAQKDLAESSDKHEKLVSALIARLNKDTLSYIFELVTAVGALIVAVVALRVNARVAWLTGAMESHSQKMLEIEALRQGKKLIWWDPLHDGPQKSWPREPKHCQELDSEEPIYVGVPIAIRRKHSCLKRVVAKAKEIRRAIKACFGREPAPQDKSTDCRSKNVESS